MSLQLAWEAETGGWHRFSPAHSPSAGTSAVARRSSGRSGGRSASSIHKVALNELGAVSHHTCSFAASSSKEVWQGNTSMSKSQCSNTELS